MTSAAVARCAGTLSIVADVFRPGSSGRVGARLRVSFPDAACFAPAHRPLRRGAAS